jgi:hypothetical protein
VANRSSGGPGWPEGRSERYVGMDSGRGEVREVLMKQAVKYKTRG